MRGELIKWFEKSGYGFVQDSNSKETYFLHISYLPKGSNPEIGNEITFTPTENEKGKQAHNAEII